MAAEGASYLKASAEEPLAVNDGGDAPCAGASRMAWLRVPRRSVGWVASIALGVAATFAVALTLSRRAAVEGEAMPPPLEAKDLVGLEELHPALVERLIHPDREQDMAELRRIGLDHPAVLKMLFQEYEMKTNLEDLRHMMAYRRRMMANTSSIKEAVSLQAAPDGAEWTMPPPAKKIWMGSDIADAKCAFHVGQTVLYLTEAALAINDAAQDCPQIHKTGMAIQGRRAGKNARIVCAIDIMAIFAGFGWTSFFISALVAQCDATGKKSNSAECADDVTAIIAALMDLGESATSVGVDCKWAGLKQAVINARMHRLKSKIVGQSQSQLGFCVIDPIQAMYWLMRGAAFIHGAAKACPTDDWESCSIDALYVVSSFGWAAGFLASAASDCAPEMNTRAQCAGDITDLVGAVTMVSAQSIAFKEGGCGVFGAESAAHPGGGVR